MSLINEALKRARLEAARQDAAKQGYVLNAERNLRRSPHESGAPSRKGLQAGLMVTAVAIVGGALIYFTSLRSSVDKLSGSLTRTEASSSELDPSADAPHHTVRAESLVDGRNVPSEPNLPDMMEQPQDLFSVPLANTVPKNGSSAASSAAPAPEIVASQAPNIDNALRQIQPQEALVIGRAVPGSGARDKIRATESYEREFTLRDGTRVELGGIAWSESGPYALVNGRVVGVGEYVGDLVVASIQPTRIELKGPDRQVFLELR